MDHARRKDIRSLSWKKYQEQFDTEEELKASLDIFEEIVALEEADKGTTTGERSRVFQHHMNKIFKMVSNYPCLISGLLTHAY